MKRDLSAQEENWKLRRTRCVSKKHKEWDPSTLGGLSIYRCIDVLALAIASTILSLVSKVPSADQTYGLNGTKAA